MCWVVGGEVLAGMGTCLPNIVTTCDGLCLWKDFAKECLYCIYIYFLCV